MTNNQEQSEKHRDRRPFIVLQLSFMIHRSSFIVRLAALLAAVALPTACREAAVSDRLVAISPHPETMLYEYQWAFQPWYRERTGRNIEIVWLDQGGTARMRRFLYNEFQRSPEGVNIDMVWGGGSDLYLELCASNLLHPYRLPEPILQAIPSEYSGVPLYDPRYRWYATALTGFGIIYNRRVLKLQDLPTPQTWADLTDPAFYSWVETADPRQSGSSHMAFEIILQAYGWQKGWEVITLMGGNIKVFTRLASDVPMDVALGEVASGFCIDNYAYSQMAFTGREVLGYVMPEGLTVVYPDGIGILRGAPNLEQAQMLVEFAVSNAGQRLLMSPIGAEGGPRQFRISRMAVLPHLYGQLGERSLVPVNPFQLRATLHYDPTKGAGRWTFLNDLIGVLIVENHDLLKKTWRAVAACDNERRAILARRLAEMPLSEDQTMTLAQKTWKDPVARNRVMLEWSRFAREKYNAVLREAQTADAAATQIAGGSAEPSSIQTPAANPTRLAR